jgi:hypothetical protein
MTAMRLLPGTEEELRDAARYALPEQLTLSGPPTTQIRYDAAPTPEAQNIRL